jgi:hypothetical protein
MHFGADYCCRTEQVGGAISSALLMAGRFLSSIFASVDGRGEAEEVVVRGIRSRVVQSRKEDAKPKKTDGSVVLTL